MRKIIAFILYWIYLPKIIRESMRTDSVLTIYGHDISRNSFEKLIKWLLKKNYHFISQYELLDYLHGNIAREKKYVWLSFDDGWKSNYDNVLPVLKKYNIPATIFIATKGIEDGYYWFEKAKENRDAPYYKEIQELWEMPNAKRQEIIDRLPKKDNTRTSITPDELKIMTESGWVYWGNHTHDHVISNQCGSEELAEQITLCQTRVQAWTGTDCNFIYSYPNGDRDENSESLIKQMGFSMAATTDLGRTYLTTNPFEIPRCEFKDDATLKENILQIYGIWTPLFDKIKKLLQLTYKK